MTQPEHPRAGDVRRGDARTGPQDGQQDEEQVVDLRDAPALEDDPDRPRDYDRHTVR